MPCQYELHICTSLFCTGRTRSQIHLVGDYYFTLGIRSEPRRKPLPTTGSSDGAPDVGATGADSTFSDDPLPPEVQEPEQKPPSPEQESGTPAPPPKPSSTRRPASGSRRFRTPRKSAKRQRRVSAVPRVLKEAEPQGQHDTMKEEEEEKKDESGELVHSAAVDESDEDLNVSRYTRSDRSRVISDSDEQEGAPLPSELPQATPSLPSAAEVEAPMASWAAGPALQGASDQALQSASDQELEPSSQSLDKGDTVYQQDEHYAASGGTWPDQVTLQEAIPVSSTPHTPHSYQPLPSPQYHASPPPNLLRDSSTNLSQWADPSSQPQRPFIPSQSGDLGVQPMGFNPQSFESYGAQMQQQPPEQQHQALTYNHSFAPLPVTRVSNTAPFPESYHTVNPGFPGAPFFRPYAGYQPGQYSVAAVRPSFDQGIFQPQFQYQFLSGQHTGLGRELPGRAWGPQHALQQLSSHRHGSQSPNRSHSPNSQPPSTTSGGTGGSRYSISDLLGGTPNSTSATPTPAHQEVHQVQPPPHETPPHFLAARVNPATRGSAGGTFEPSTAAEYNRLMQQQQAAARQWLFHHARQMATLQRSASPSMYHMGASHPFIPSLGGQTLGTAPPDLLPSNEEDSRP